MKIDVVIILYNPTDAIICNSISYAKYFNRVFIIDNSEKPNFDIKILEKYNNITYFKMRGNEGIASALNKGTEMAINDNADFCLTMDQDSFFPYNRLNDIKNILSSPEVEQYGIVGLELNKKQSENIKLINVNWLLTSGNFINLNNFKKLDNRFDNRLFIDAVDCAICYSFRKIGLKIAYIEGISIRHTIGNPQKRKFLNKEFTLMNYSPIRYYYIFRNNIFLYRTDKKAFKENFKSLFFSFLPKVLFFEKNKTKKLKAIFRGIKDGVKSKLGKCKHTFN